jgi:hypothetical protein
MPKMSLTPYSTMTNNNEQRTMNSSKQSQTKPILSALVADKIALPASAKPKAKTGACRRAYGKFVEPPNLILKFDDIRVRIEQKTKGCVNF